MNRPWHIWCAIDCGTKPSLLDTSHTHNATRVCVALFNWMDFIHTNDFIRVHSLLCIFMNKTSTQTSMYKYGEDETQIGSLFCSLICVKIAWMMQIRCVCLTMPKFIYSMLVLRSILRLFTSSWHFFTFTFCLVTLIIQIQIEMKSAWHVARANIATFNDCAFSLFALGVERWLRGRTEMQTHCMWLVTHRQIKPSTAIEWNGWVLKMSFPLYLSMVSGSLCVCVRGDTAKYDDMIVHLTGCCCFCRANSLFTLKFHRQISFKKFLRGFCSSATFVF